MGTGHVLYTLSSVDRHEKLFSFVAAVNTPSGVADGSPNLGWLYILSGFIWPEQLPTGPIDHNVCTLLQCGQSVLYSCQGQLPVPQGHVSAQLDDPGKTTPAVMNLEYLSSAGSGQALQAICMLYTSML